ncbi:MAG: hypothetical protein JSU67_03450 [Gammaproteobacteria bacterium]|nr:MAG: hypothetical protein JSU67_03450 [Gammaproteobacteria bacterium]
MDSPRIVNNQLEMSNMKSTSSKRVWGIGQSLVLAMLIAVGSFAGAQAGGNNGKGKGKPTDPVVDEPDTASIIGDANVVCDLAINHDVETEQELIETACRLMVNTDGNRDGKGQNCTPDTEGNPEVRYTGKNCDNNEDTLRRDAGSVVTSLGDAFIESPAEGDDPCPKLEQASINIDSYIYTYDELTALEEGEDKAKLTDNAEPTLEDDADTIAWGIAIIYSAECVVD